MSGTKMRLPQVLQGHRSGSRLVGYVAITMMTWGISPGLAADLPEVRGSFSDLQLRANDAPIRQVLDALGRSFKVTYYLPSSVNRVVSGSFSGSLPQVLARLLDGHNYIIREMEDAAEVVVLGAAGITTVSASDLLSVSAPAPTPQLPTDVQKPIAEAASAPLKPLSSFR
jgi:hypothetical protein